MGGQNILDVLEYPGFSRRSLVQVIGTNSLPEEASNFNCDRCYLVPPTAAVDYPSRIREILLKERPHLILCCRDEDTYALSQLKTQHPELPGALPVGGPHAALIGFDKWQTWLFARRHTLPFAESFMPGEAGDDGALEAFGQRVGYPLIAKPARGEGARGVFYVRDFCDAQVMAQRDGYLFEEYLGDSRSLESYFAILQGPPPLFAHSKNAENRVCYTVVDPRGDIAPILVYDCVQMEGRHPILYKRILDPALDALTQIMPTRSLPRAEQDR
jgi:carbamoyl-phosphate synthase large subunit